MLCRFYILCHVNYDNFTHTCTHNLRTVTTHTRCPKLISTLQRLNHSQLLFNSVHSSTHIGVGGATLLVMIQGHITLILLPSDIQFLIFSKASKTLNNIHDVHNVHNGMSTLSHTSSKGKRHVVSVHNGPNIPHGPWTQSAHCCHM